MAYKGTTPINLSFDAVQALSIRDVGVLYIGYDMRLHFIGRVRNLPSLTLDMGDDLVDKDVYEFTVSDIDIYRYIKIIIKNSHGNARYVTIYARPIAPEYEEILTDVIKVAGGEILFAKKESYVVENKKYLQVGENGVIDIIPNGNGGVTKIYANNSSANICSILGNYKLMTNGDLFLNGIKIASNIISIYNTNFGKIEGLLVGRIFQNGFMFNDDKIVKDDAYKHFRDAGVEDDWITAYDKFMSNQIHPTCDWVGSGTSTSKPIGYYQFSCTKQLATRSIPFSYLATSSDGDTYKVVNDVLTKIDIPYPNADGFNHLYGNNKKDPILFEHFSGGANVKKLYFEEPELSTSHRSELILRR